MGLSMLPDELLVTLADQWPCRDVQLKHTAGLLSPMLPSPSSLVVYGPRATGKSGLVQAYLENAKLRHAIIRCQECITGRHLLERTVGVVHDVIATYDGIESLPRNTGRCENLSALSVHLQSLLKNRPKFVLVFDGVDKQREAPLTLLPALTRLGETIAEVTVVLIMRYPASGLLRHQGVPHVHFTPYTRNQSIHIVARDKPDIFLEPSEEEAADYTDEQHEEDKSWLWPRYCAAVWDAIAENAARDLIAFREACHKLWRPFVNPIISGEFGTRNFSRLLVAQRRLFQDENFLLDSILPRSEGSTLATSKTQDLPYHAKWLLVAAYLASFNPARLDTAYFMKSAEKVRRKKGGGTARGRGRPSQARKIPRHLLAASAFALDRLLAILHAILPDDIRTSIDIYKQIATLSSLRLLVRAGGVSGGDPLETGGKWRTGPMVTWEHVSSLSRSLDFDIANYAAE